jgi:hypothetical protein
MSKEIKFRAWDIDEKRMYQNSINYAFWRVVADWKHTPVVMQYTGLHDHNGVEIYEGDIARRTDLPLDRSVGKVVYVNDTGIYAASFVLELPDGSYVSLHTKHCEVIGNIYENPELLKGPDHAE